MVSTTSHRIATAAALLALLAAAGCAKPGGVECTTGIFCPPGWQCAARQATCIQGTCGNGIVDPGEACDDGNVIDGDGCSANCMSNETCGNGIKDVAVGEVCDPPSEHCSADCKSNMMCGNGVVDPGEDCDAGPSGVDNVAVATFLCNSDCTWARCGDGKVNTAAGEQCDRNGDGVAGRNGQSATCNADCSVSVCGDDFVNADAGEECDRGPGGNSDAGDCTSACKVNVCGDGFQNKTTVNGRSKEECDHGPENSDTGACTTECKVARCGDGHVQGGVEGCDEGPDSATDKIACPYGQQSCTLCALCQWKTLTGPYCGDDTKQANEACDDGANNGATTCAYGEATCQICNSSCSVEVARTGPYCGDGVRQSDSGESCDDGPRNGSDSCPYGQQHCDVCNTNCTGTVSRAGPSCGDNHIDDADLEKCDSVASFACGTCGLPGHAQACQHITAYAYASGSITVVSADQLAGVTFTLTDDTRKSAPITFEFVNGTSPTGSNVSVSVAGSQTGTVADAATIAANIAAAVSSQLNIAATVQGSTVTLSNNVLGAIGNALIEITPADTSALTATGMQSGVGCRRYQACDVNQDCIGGTSQDAYCDTTSKVCRSTH